jgi:hypothetical protein
VVGFTNLIGFEYEMYNCLFRYLIQPALSACKNLLQLTAEHWQFAVARV